MKKKRLLFFSSIALLVFGVFYFFGSSLLSVGSIGDTPGSAARLRQSVDAVNAGDDSSVIRAGVPSNPVVGEGLNAVDGGSKENKAEVPIGESAVLSGDALSLSKAKKLLDKDNFPVLLRGFAGKYAGDPEAQELKKIYLSTMKEKLAVRNDVSGIDFECGTSVCVGEVNMSGNKDDEGLVSGIFGPPTPAYGLLETSEVVGGVVEKRFVFSTDPKVNAISSN
ncbi:hypothetical protein [Xanthomonas sacchari]|uniref:hypothetical protein n=1 Tax=Xanthomonas sacchari TaxID=56458 RepID=UPI00225AA776|nr:hypothetical protein [Xanthomonas sacchari]